MPSILYSRSLIIALLFISIFFVPVYRAEAGFGVSPGNLKEDNLVPGSTLERTIYLVQGNQDEDIPVKVSVESKDIQDWITFKNGNEFIIPARVQQFPLDVVIKVPEDADLGNYDAFIRISTQPKQVENSQITIALGGVVGVNLVVGDDIVSSFEVKSIDILDVFEGDNAKISVTILNTGNVPVSPENASFELFNKYGEVRLAYGENDNFEKVPSFSEGKVVLEFPLNVTLGVGEYWGHVKIYDNGKVVKELKTVFDVVKKGFFEKHLYSLIAVGAVVIIAISFIFLRRRRRY
jgi:hypothetical protein